MENAFFQDFTYILLILFRSQPLKVVVRKITPVFGSASGVAMDIAQYADRNWRFSWLILLPQEKSWFIIDRVYWRKQIKQQVIRVPDDSQDQKMVTEAAT